MPDPIDPKKVDLNPETPENTEQKPETGDVLGEILPSQTTEHPEEKGSTPSRGESFEDILGETNASGSVSETSKSIESFEDVLESSPQQIPSDTSTETITPLDDNEVLLGSNSANSPESEQSVGSKIVDINISSFEDIAHILVDDGYDFVTLEPSETEVKVSFRKDSVEKLVKYIKAPTYSTVLLKTKQVTQIPTEQTGETLEGKGAIELGNKAFDVLGKVSPGQYGEKVFIKLKENFEKKAKKIQKTSIGTIFGFLGAILFVALILGGAFITFIILNAQTVEDVRFFSSLGINLNEINTFISRVVTFIFSIVLLIETSVLAIFLFKFFLTKKQFKRKRVVYGIVSVVLLMVTFTSASAWMIIDAKIKGLPNWQELAYGAIQIFDNDKLTSDAFDRVGSLLSNTENLIGPITIRYDLTLFESNEAKKGLTIKKYKWRIGSEVIEEINPILIKEFTTKGNYEVSLIVEETDARGITIEKAVDNIPSLSVAEIVEVKETVTRNGGKIVEFDATELQKFGKLEWYFATDLEKPVWDGYTFKPSQIFFEETIIALNIVSDARESQTKVFVIGGESTSEIAGEIVATRSLVKDLTYNLKVTNPQTSFGDGFIEEFEWKIGNKSIKKQADPTDLEKSSSIDFDFTSYGQNDVSVILKDSSGKTKELTTVVDIPRNVELKKSLDIWNNNEILEDVRYIEKGNEYFVDELGIPTVLKLDARLVRSENLIYSLKEVSWDFGNNDSIDETGKSVDYSVNTEGNHTVVVNYKFVHRTIPSDIINIKEFIYIEGVKKEAVVDLKIEKDTDYVPVTVRFDASRSTIKDDDVIKFEYDYGDGVVEVRDAINPGHRYTEPGDYTVKLTITGRSGKKYSGEKSLILKPAPQEVKIGVSLKNAPVGQGIDFSSAESDGQITEYFWEFGDGNTSVEANPTHAYKKSGTYSVKLRVDFANKNSLVDETEIEVYEE